MTQQLTKGANCALTTESEEGHALAIGIHWDAAHADLDVVALVCDANRRVLSDGHFLFWDQPQDPDSQVFLRWTPRGQQSSGLDRAQGLLNLAELKPEICHIYLALATITDGVTIRAAGNYVVTVRDLTAGGDLIRYVCETPYESETCAIVCEVYRHRGQWKLRIHDAGYSAGLAAFGRDYGANIA